MGEGGVGVGPKRVAVKGQNQIKKRIPRNAQALFNVGALRVFFHDGRLGASPDYGNGVNSPAEEWLPKGLNSVLAAQALFPMTSQFEMAGNPKENEVAGAIHDRIDAAWPIIAKRVRGIEAYAKMFADEGVEEVAIADIGNALAAFMDAEWRSFDSPYDLGTMDAAQQRGEALFFGEAQCSTCHEGPLFTDEDFHAIGLPPFGPGRTRRFDPMPRDVGRMAESDALEDAYRFRTPSLRNVALTAPYGHNGAYPTLEGIIQHHTSPLESLAAWQPEMAQLPEVPWLQRADFVIHQDTREMARVRANIDIDVTPLSDTEIARSRGLYGGIDRHGVDPRTSWKTGLGAKWVGGRLMRVLVAGSAALDFVYQMDTLPERAEKYAARAVDIVGGGCAANAAVAIARLGGESQLLARFGKDSVCEIVLGDIRAENVDTSPCVMSEGARSAMSSVYVDKSGERQIMAFSRRGIGR